MAVQEPFIAARRGQIPNLSLLPPFKISAEDDRLKGVPKALTKVSEEPIGVLSDFTGQFIGYGFNSIFRPNSGQTTFPKTPTPLKKPFSNNNLLALNLTVESLSFAPTLQDVPNRGANKQPDIHLNGVPYAQHVYDVTNVHNGKPDETLDPIHFEAGVWMYVPQTDDNPKLQESLCRMASIPHGTTINAQGIVSPTVQGPPDIGPVDMTPIINVVGGNADDEDIWTKIFKVAEVVVDGVAKVLEDDDGTADLGEDIAAYAGIKHRFPSQNVTDGLTARLPQDLTPFINAGTITQEIVNNPSHVLKEILKHQQIIKTITFNVSTKLTKPFNSGGGTRNINFLDGEGKMIEFHNARAADTQATFWIETVAVEVLIPPWKQGDAAMEIEIPAATSMMPVPTFQVTPSQTITETTAITVTYKQIQYRQVVNLVFSGITWPHVSVATLVPSRTLTVPGDCEWNPVSKN